MEINSAKPAATEVASVTAAASEQAERFNQRKSEEAQSDVKNEAVFFSPVVKIDTETHTAVIQYRDPNTGAVTREYPDKTKYGAYEQAQDTAKSDSSDDTQVIPVISDAKPQPKADAVKSKPEQQPQQSQQKVAAVDQQA